MSKKNHAKNVAPEGKTTTVVEDTMNAILGRPSIENVKYSAFELEVMREVKVWHKAQRVNNERSAVIARKCLLLVNDKDGKNFRPNLRMLNVLMAAIHSVAMDSKAFAKWVCMAGGARRWDETKKTWLFDETMPNCRIGYTGTAKTIDGKKVNGGSFYMKSGWVAIARENECVLTEEDLRWATTHNWFEFKATTPPKLYSFDEWFNATRKAMEQAITNPLVPREYKELLEEITPAFQKRGLLEKITPKAKK